VTGRGAGEPLVCRPCSLGSAYLSEGASGPGKVPALYFTLRTQTRDLPGSGSGSQRFEQAEVLPWTTFATLDR